MAIVALSPYMSSFLVVFEMILYFWNKQVNLDRNLKLCHK